MPSYTEGDSIQVVVGGTPTMLKPILFTTYDTVTKYNLHITYEDSTTKDVELVQKDKERPYKVVYKKDGALHTVIGIPTIYEVNEGNKFCDFVNKIMDSNDLLFEMDCSSQFECTKVRFYLKDIRDIIDLVTEGIDDGTDNGEVFPFSMYPIYLNGQSCSSIIDCTVDDNLEVTLTSMITKLGEPITEDGYSNFTILSVEGPVIVNPDVLFENNKVPLRFPEETLERETKIILKYFVNEINHPVFDEFTVVAHRNIDNGTDELPKTPKRLVATTQDMLYLGDGVKTGLGSDLTPGYKAYKHRKNYKPNILE